MQKKCVNNEIRYPVTARGLFLQSGLLFKSLIQDHISHKTLTYLENASASFLELVHMQHWSLWRFNYICECSTGGSEICNLKEYLYFFDGICYIWMLSFFHSYYSFAQLSVSKGNIAVKYSSFETYCMFMIVRYWLLSTTDRNIWPKNPGLFYLILVY